MGDHWGEWDEQPVGHGYKNKSRLWNRGVYQYFAIVIGIFGAFMTIGAVGHFTPLRVVGALCVLASTLTFARADRAARKYEDGSRYVPWRRELLWLLTSVVLVVGGGAVFTSF